jgi:hypothetical protein
MSSYNEQVQEDAARFSEDFFGPSIPSNYEQMPPPNYSQNYLDSSSQMPPPNYPQNYPQML